VPPNTKRAHVPGAKKTVTDVADEYLAKLRVEGRCGGDSINRVKRFIAYWGDTLVEDITTDDVSEWVRTEFGDLVPGSIARYLKSFSAILNYGVSAVSAHGTA
jgi:hypothetical protein